MPRTPKPPIDPDDAPLKRLGSGRWQTRDERFTIEPQSGTWVVVDAEQTDDFGMALVRGPFPSLTAAKDAIAAARASAPAESPLAGQIERRNRAPVRAADDGHPGAAEVVDGDARDATPVVANAHDGAGTRTRAGAGQAPSRVAPPPRDRAGRGRSARSEPAAEPRTGSPKPARTAEPQPQPQRRPEPEPAWIADLSAAERGRARRLMAALRAAGLSDAEGLVRRDLVGGVPSLAALAIARRLEELGRNAQPRSVAELLAEGRDDELGVRWRLVDGDGRPIVLDPSARRRG